jgi:hypothetical protein
MKNVKLEKVMRDLDGFDYEVKMYIYHSLNGREEEAQSYLNAYTGDVQNILNELKPVTNEEFKSIPESTIQDNSEEVDERQGATLIKPTEQIEYNIHNCFE